MSKYAEGTQVSTERSRAEIEKLLRKYAATGFMYAWQDLRVVIGFELFGRAIRFELPMPDPTSAEFWETPTGKKRTEAAALQALEQETRRRWRALFLAIKAKLETVASGIATFEDEFLSYIVTTDGRTVGEHVRPSLTAGAAPRLQLPSTTQER